MTALTLVCSKALAAALPEAPCVRIDDTRELISWDADATIFPDEWRAEPFFAAAKPIDPSQQARARALVTRAIQRYPGSLITNTLLRVYVVGELTFFKNIPFGGTASDKAVYLAVQPESAGFTDRFITETFHREYSTLLLNLYLKHLDQSAWNAVNANGFRYLGANSWERAKGKDGGAKAIESGAKSLSPQAGGEYLNEGFLSEYSKSSLENDFNEYAAALFMNEAEFQERVAKYPVVRKKRDLALRFYSAIAPELTFDSPAPGLPPTADLGPEFLQLGIEARAQGERDTCSLFAVTALADFECRRSGLLTAKRLSEEFLVWAANEATGLEGDQAMFSEAVHGLNRLGVCAEELMPYGQAADAGRAPSKQALADAKDRSERWRVVWIKRWDLLRPLGEEDVAAIKRALACGHPVACGLRWPKVLNTAALLEVPPPGEVFDGHSIVLTGYEDAPEGDGGGIFRFRNSSGPQWGQGGYGTMSYAYARAYANDALWLRFGAPGSEVPAERFEAERMEILSKERCAAAPQQMGEWGERMWSNGSQLWCKAEQGGGVELGFDVRSPGRYRLRLLATAAPDAGVIRVSLDGKPLEPEFDLYAGRVCPSDSLELGDHDLVSGPHRLRVTAVRKTGVSTNFFFGLDAVDLIDLKCAREGILR